MNDVILNFVNDTDNGEYNFNLALWYESQGYTAPALSFFLRAAEKSEDKLLAYNALLKGFMCYNRQGARDDSAKILLQNAIAYLPRRPEAYFLLCEFYEKYKYWQDCYIYASIALECANFYDEPLPAAVGFPGKYSLLFYKGISGYWWGKGEESRIIFQTLINDYELAEPYKFIVIERITALGSGPARKVFLQYKKDDHYNKLKYKFDTCENIKENYSQAYQDIFVLYMLNGKQSGSYLEIGCGDPFWLNNTYLLEKNYKWKGVGVDINSEIIKKYNDNRNNIAIQTNAHDIDYDLLIKKYFDSDTIDYLQLDCEPSESTYKLLHKIPFDKYKFKIITFEHDYYVDMERKYRDLSRDFLIKQGYELVISNVSCTDWSSFEDWWVHPDLIDKDKVCSIKNTDATVKKINDYFLEDNQKTKLNKNNIFFSSSSLKNKTAIIVDNFYDFPDQIREFALSQEFSEGGFGKGYIGNRTTKQYLFDGLKEKFEDILGKKITSWYDQPMNGRFQITYAGQPLVYHCDAQKWAGMIYLTPNAPFECGTTLYAHKITKARSYNDPGWDYSWKDTHLGDLHLDGTFFEPVDVLGNVYNRLVIFDGSNIHAASKYFGQIDSNSRLWHMFFFD